MLLREQLKVFMVVLMVDLLDIFNIGLIIFHIVYFNPIQRLFLIFFLMNGLF